MAVKGSKTAKASKPRKPYYVQQRYIADWQDVDAEVLVAYLDKVCSAGGAVALRYGDKHLSFIVAAKVGSQEITVEFQDCLQMGAWLASRLLDDTD